MKKSKKMYRLALAIGLLICPVMIMTDRESLKNIWLVGILAAVTLVMVSIGFYAIKLEERGE
jgi:hypothetical protein